MKYARLEDFDRIIKTLMADPKAENLALTLGDETAMLSLLLRVYVLPDLNDEAAFMVRELCNKLAEEIIRRYPFSEGYIDYLIGVAALGRSAAHN